MPKAVCWLPVCRKPYTLINRDIKKINSNTADSFFKKNEDELFDNPSFKELSKAYLDMINVPKTDEDYFIKAIWILKAKRNGLRL